MSAESEGCPQYRQLTWTSKNVKQYLNLIEEVKESSPFDRGGAGKPMEIIE